MHENSHHTLTPQHIPTHAPRPINSLYCYALEECIGTWFIYQSKQDSGIWTCDIHMVHNPNACCGLVIIGELHPTLPTLPLLVYLPLMYSALKAQTTLSTSSMFECIRNVSVEMCAVILTSCSVVRIVHSTHNSREEE